MQRTGQYWLAGEAQKRADIDQLKGFDVDGQHLYVEIFRPIEQTQPALSRNDYLFPLDCVRELCVVFA